VLEYNEAHTQRGNDLKVAKPCSSYDRDAAVVVGYLLSRPDCNGRIGTIGMCLGGHLALRCALLPKVSFETQYWLVIYVKACWCVCALSFVCLPVSLFDCLFVCLFAVCLVG
jgi:hypothetical protein